MLSNINNIISEEIRKYIIKEVSIPKLTLYHGTPHNFIKFDTKNIGNGEGSQCFGYGLYFTENKSVAEYYANLLKREHGYVYTVTVENGEFFNWYEKIDKTFKEKFIDKMNEMGYAEMPYKRMLENGKIVTYKMPIKDAIDYFPNGKFFYDNMVLLLGNEKNASEFLYKMGFAGIKYPIGSFMKRERSSLYGFNYVIFDGDAVTIINKETID